MTSTPNIILLGLRACGKTTLGQSLAARLSRPFVDLDDVTAAMMGCVDVPEAWAMHGPGAFREAEVMALREVIATLGQVVALGGGTPTAPGAADLLREHAARGKARLIYIRATPSTLRVRLAQTDLLDRPSLTGEGVLEEVDRVFRDRDGAYRKLATSAIDVDGLAERECLEKLVQAVGA